ncbi:MAG: segregation and condensation protein A [Aminivibrio sp.]
MTGLSDFQAEVSGFSGPFDLLCYLVENGELEAAGISVGHAVKIYGAYLANTRHVSVAVVSEFLAMAASLILAKIKSLIPGSSAGREADGEDPEQPAPEPDVEEQLARYRPYRRAASFLQDKKERQDRKFSPALWSEESQTWDLGDLYGLCTIWWDLLESWRGTGTVRTSSDCFWEDGLDGAPLPLPDEEQIDMKMLEIKGALETVSEISFSSLVMRGDTVGSFVVTLLALLELCRKGAVKIVQEALFGDVLILSAD